MSEDLRKLRETIGELRSELNAMDDIDGEAEALLKNAVDDIESTLERHEAEETTAEETTDANSPESIDDEEPSVVDRLTDAAQEYEESHPTLSGIIGSIIDTLSRMGI